MLTDMKKRVEDTKDRRRDLLGDFTRTVFERCKSVGRMRATPKKTRQGLGDRLHDRPQRVIKIRDVNPFISSVLRERMSSNRASASRFVLDLREFDHCQTNQSP